MDSNNSPNLYETDVKNNELNQLIELLKEGHARINKYQQNAVLLIGITGEGKSTICSLFGGYKLVAKWNENQEQVNIDHEDQEHGGPIIGQWSVSTTRIPNQVLKEHSHND